MPLLFQQRRLLPYPHTKGLFRIGGGQGRYSCACKGFDETHVDCRLGYHGEEAKEREHPLREGQYTRSKRGSTGARSLLGEVCSPELVTRVSKQCLFLILHCTRCDSVAINLLV